MAHPNAADLLDYSRCSARGQRAADRVMDLPTAQGKAARAHADTDLTYGSVMRLHDKVRWAAFGVKREKCINHLTRAVRVEIAVGDVVYLDHRRKRTTTQARDLLDREQSLGIRIVA